MTLPKLASVLEAQKKCSKAIAEENQNKTLHRAKFCIDPFEEAEVFGGSIPSGFTRRAPWLWADGVFHLRG